ncbi:hypothetical protein JRQ81_008706 [Phrynocephalus forsythii]|uniref:Radial spoke head 3 n=1 Tax=Phrynocephalus forsythii TaxID=171643 RepID=A0A9Q0XCH9_9SAUR|nr:hypothetical protein JRQ81_008706 [Phrynocephalus forsythii]
MSWKRSPYATQTSCTSVAWSVATRTPCTYCPGAASPTRSNCRGSGKLIAKPWPGSGPKSSSGRGLQSLWRAGDMWTSRQSCTWKSWPTASWRWTWSAKRTPSWTVRPHRSSSPPRPGGTWPLRYGKESFSISTSKFRPMLEVLVGKTIEQALLEVMEEEELADLRAHQYAYHELRLAELAEVQRLEEQERRHREEKERRKKQQLQALQKEKETSEKIAARAFAQRYLSDLLPSVFGSLRDSGYFYDPVERDIETGFVTWMMDQVEETMEKRVLGRTLADSLIRQVTEMRLESFQQGALLYPYQVEVVQPPEEEEEKKDKEEEEKEEEEAGQQPAPEEVAAVSSGEPGVSDQLDVPLQPGLLDLPEVAGPVEAPAEPEPSAPPPDGLDEPLNAVQPDVSDQPEASDQGKQEGGPDTGGPEPQE